jgi:hypothetical protein
MIKITSNITPTNYYYDSTRDTPPKSEKGETRTIHWIYKPLIKQELQLHYLLNIFSFSNIHSLIK